jgi:hypothetical protein
VHVDEINSALLAKLVTSSRVVVRVSGRLLVGGGAVVAEARKERPLDDGDG